MRDFEDRELILQKALANKILHDIVPAKNKINKITEKIVSDIAEVEKKLQDATDVQKVAVFSKDLKMKQGSLVTTLALKDRIDAIISKNEQRVAYISKLLKNAGIYDEKVNKSELSAMEKQEKDNVSAELLNLNKVDGKTICKRFFCGELLTFIDGLLDFSLEENLEIARSVSVETLTKIVMAYPASASTVPDSMFLDVRFKQNYLKAIATFVAEESKTKSMGQVNKELGGLLNFKTEFTRTMTDFVAGVQNLLDVTCKQLLQNKRPDLASEIEDKLRCNESSELLPTSKKVAVLAQGVAGDVEKTEEQESEEVRKVKEQETEKATEFNSYLDKLFEQMLEVEQEEIEQQIQEETQRREEYKLMEEKKKKEEEEKATEEELEQSLGKSYTKHDN